MTSDAMSEIHAAIPHRDPFLFVDRIVERAESRLVTEWDVPAQAPFFRGHYPGNPLVPGVLICESAFQTGAILCAGDARDALNDGAVPVLTKIGDARFKRTVLPGETLRCELVLDERLGTARYMTAKVTCQGETVLRIEFVVAVVPAAATGAPKGS
jgi:3-hydroxyacyl-[acyl-carrier-protein] dehydratase